MTYPPPGGTPDPTQPQPLGQQPGQEPPYGQPSPYGPPSPYGQQPNDPTAPLGQPHQDPYAAPGSFSAPPASTPPASGPPSSAPPGQPYGDPQYGAPQQPYGGQYPPAYPAAGYGAPQTTNVMAILSLVFAFVFAPVGIVLGHIAKKQIKERGEEGAGLATAGLVISYVITGLYALGCCGFIVSAVVASNNGTGY